MVLTWFLEAELPEVAVPYLLANLSKSKNCIVISWSLSTSDLKPNLCQTYLEIKNVL